MKKPIILFSSFAFALALFLTSTTADAGFCYATFDGNSCDTNEPANCIDECSIVGDERIR